MLLHESSARPVDKWDKCANVNLPIFVWGCIRHVRWHLRHPTFLFLLEIECWRIKRVLSCRFCQSTHFEAQMVLSGYVRYFCSANIHRCREVSWVLSDSSSLPSPNRCFADYTYSTFFTHLTFLFHPVRQTAWKHNVFITRTRKVLSQWSSAWANDFSSFDASIFATSICWHSCWYLVSCHFSWIPLQAACCVTMMPIIQRSLWAASMAF